ncbi:MAG: hypothetical protein K0Q55_3077 [Verrucomicrobia bacterium]|jgi:tetratricopeptide (TPR) repeat protein|nr:hypothetical protein [Verrucomicrobiota bacterium]
MNVKSMCFLSVLIACLGSLEGATFREEVQEAVEMPILPINVPYHISVSVSGTMREMGEPGAYKVAKVLAEAKALAEKEKENLKRPEYFLELARKWDIAQKEEEALATYQKLADLLKRKPEESRLHKEMLMEATHQLDQVEEAERLARELLKSDPKTASAWFVLGHTSVRKASELVMEAKGVISLKALCQKLFDMPRDAGVLVLIRQHLEESIESYTQCIRAAPLMPGTYGSRAYAVAFLEAVKFHASKQEGDFNLQGAMNRSSRLDELDAPEANLPDNVWVLSWVVNANIVRRMMTPEPIAEQKKSMRAFLKSNQSLVDELAVFLKREDPDEAITAVQTLALAHLAADLLPTAADYLEKVVQLRPDHEEYWQCYLHALEESDQLDRMLKAGEKRVSVKPDLWTCLMMANGYANKKDKENAKLMIEKADKIEAQNGHVMLFKTAWIFKFSTKEEEWSAISPMLAQLSENESLGPVILANIAYYRAVYFALKGIPAVARVHLENSESLRPDNGAVAKLRELLKDK